MPSYTPLKTKYPRGECNVLIRLNKQDTEKLKKRVMEAESLTGGVNFILLRMRPSISLTESPERGKQVKFIAFSDETSFSPDTIQRGYNGKWSHVEIAMNDEDLLKQWEDKTETESNLKQMKF